MDIMGRSGVAIIDTGATHCIASPSLYRILVESGVKFQDTQRIIRLADGSRISRKLLTAEVPVNIGGRELPADFLVLPGDETRTLLGVEFLTRAGMVVDIAHGKWTFADDPEHSYDFVRDYQINSTAKLMRAGTVDLSLHDVKGMKLTPELRYDLDEVIDLRSAQFTLDGPATEIATRRTMVSQQQEPLVPRTDSSGYGIGTALMQGEGPDKTPVHYTPGSMNAVVDTMSKPVYTLDPDCDKTDMPKRSSCAIRENQRKDPEVCKVIDDLESDEASRGRPWSDRYPMKTHIRQNREDVGKCHISHLTPFVGTVPWNRQSGRSVSAVDHADT